MNNPDLSFLKSLTDNLTEVRRNQLCQMSSGWVRLERCLGSLTENELLQLLAIEMQGAQRPIILSRVFSRFQSLRKERERNELLCSVPLPIADRIRKLSTKAGMK